MPSKFVSVNMSPDARNAVQRMAAIASGQVQRRVTLSASLLAALHVAERHMSEVAERLEEDRTKGRDE